MDQIALSQQPFSVLNSVGPSDYSIILPLKIDFNNKVPERLFAVGN